MLLDYLLLTLGGQNIRECHGHAGTSSPVETGVLDAVQGLRNGDLRVALGQIVDQRGNQALVGNGLHPGVIRGKELVEQCPTKSGLVQRSAALLEALRSVGEVQILDANLDLGVQVQCVLIHGHDGFGDRAKRATLTLDALFQSGQVVQADDHVLGRNSHGATIRGLQDVVRREHQHASFSLGLHGEWQVNCHLVTVEVSVEGSTDQRVELDSFTFDQLGLERLNTQAVQGWCTVEQDGALPNDLFENIPHLRA